MRKRFVGVLALALAMSVSPGSAAQERIINGAPAAEGDYPWMVGIVYGYETADGPEFFQCGGSVIAPNWVMTAAHCTYGEIDGTLVALPPEAFLQVRAGSTLFDEGGQLLTPTEIVRHPAYEAGGFRHDVALIRTEEVAEVAPVALARPGEEALNDPPTQARVLGWGLTEEDATSNDLLWVDAPIVADGAETCGQGFGTVFEASLHVCAGSATPDGSPQAGDSACAGDSGGPLFSDDLGERLQVGIVSFGPSPFDPGCGVGRDGVFTQLTTFYDWIDTATGGLPPRTGDSPDPGETPEPPPAGGTESCATSPGVTASAQRIQVGDGNDPIAQAIAMSASVWAEGAADFGVLASSADFADALGGSALAGDRGPLLYVDEQRRLGEDTVAELQRVVPAGNKVYILGGEAVIGPEVETQLTDAGFAPARLGGEERQQTARLVAAETASQVAGTVDEGVNGGRTPFNAVIVAYEGNWPDAVAAGQISAWFRIPVLLTPNDRLGGPAEDYLRERQPELVLVMGGDAVVGPAARAQIEAITGEGSIQRLFGPSRLDTSAAIATYHRHELFPRNGEVFDFGDSEPPTSPTVVLAVNLRRADAFAHVLGASSVAGRAGVVFAPLEGDDGAHVADAVLDAICGMNVPVVGVGGPELVADSAIAALAEASAGTPVS